MSKPNLARRMATVYATDLKERLEAKPSTEPGCVRPELPMTDTVHLIWMCDQIIEREDFSETKAHRWIGYIQGVMTARGLTTVEFERKHYVELKKGLADELGTADEPV